MSGTTRDFTVDGGVAEADGWRGNPAARRASIHHQCLHCGTPLQRARECASGFCCAGCQYVHRLVHEHGLEGFYRLRDAVVAPADPAVFQPRDYAWLGELQRKAESAAGRSGGAPAPSTAAGCDPELTLEIQGISCAGCVWLIEKLFHQQLGALAIETDAQLGRMRWRWAPGVFDAAAFARTLQSFNYLVGPPGTTPAASESRWLARRVGLCAAFAMNVMLFTLPVYFGMAADFRYAGLFGLLSLAFATLSLLTGGTYFLARAVRALRDGVMHIDLPIAVGIVGAYAGSFYGWLVGHEPYVYFDFVAAFILLMLVGRWAQVTAVEGNRRRLLTVSARPERVCVATAAGAEERAVEEIASGDVLLVKPGQVLPVEARLTSAAGTFGTAWITGEAEPRTCRAGARVPAGAFNVGRTAVRLTAAQPWRDSLLAQLLAPSRRDPWRHRFLERVISGYLIGIFVIATAAGIGWWAATHDLLQTGAVVTAVLVVSCPCAIGLAFPLADEMAAAAARRAGVFVREADLWPRLARIRRIVFDKTGTLTLETPVLANPEALGALAAADRAALLAMVRDNAHPVSQSLSESLLAEGGALVNRLEADGEISEEPGQGVMFRRGEDCWTLGRPGWRAAAAECHLSSDIGPGLAAVERHPLGDIASRGDAGTTVHDAEFRRNGAVVARFSFRDEIRPGACEEIAALRREGYEVFILSGDRRGKVEAMAAALALPAAHAVGGVTPAEKAAWLRGHDRRDTLMLGDGANDSLAFDAAFVRGTPVIHRGVLEHKADFYQLGRGLDGLRKLLAVNRSRRFTQMALLGFSVTYNALAVGLAVAGAMNPLLAAILMPASSLVTLAIVGGGMRRWVRVDAGGA